MEDELTSKGSGVQPPDADENLRILWHKITGNFTILNTSMILIKIHNDHTHTHSNIQHLQFITDYDPL